MSLQKLEILRTLWHTKRATLEGVIYDDQGMPAAISGIDRDQALTDGDSGNPEFQTYVLTLQVWDGWDGWAQDDDKPRAIRVVFPLTRCASSPLRGERQKKGIGMFEKSMHVSQTEAEWREAHEKTNEWWHSTEAKRAAAEWLKAHYPKSTWDDPIHHRSFQVAACRLNLTVAHYREYGHPNFTYDDLTREDLANVLYYAGVESPLLDLPKDYAAFFQSDCRD